MAYYPGNLEPDRLLSTVRRPESRVWSPCALDTRGCRSRSVWQALSLDWRIPPAPSASDVAHVAFEVVDSSGTVVPTANHLVRITVSGGEMLAIDNANLQDLEPYEKDRRRAYGGRGLAYLRAERPGQLSIIAAADGLGSASVSVVVRQGRMTPAIPPAR